MMSLPPYGIITKGLGLPACKGLIVGHFYLGLFKVEVVVDTGGGGGSRPLRPGEIQDFYKPVEPDKTFNQKKDYYNVTVRVTMAGKTTSSFFQVRPGYGKVIAKIINIKQALQNNISVMITNLTTKIRTVTVGKIRNKRDATVTIKDIKKDNV